MKRKIITLLFLLAFCAGITSAQDVRLQYECLEIPEVTQGVRFKLNLINESAETIDLSNTKIHYFFEEEHPSQIFFVDWAAMGNHNVTGTFKDGYLEIGFISSAPGLAPNSETGVIQIRFSNTGWINMDQSNDPSFDASVSPMADYEAIHVFYNTVKIWPGSTGPVYSTTEYETFDPLAPESDPTVSISGVSQTASSYVVDDPSTTSITISVDIPGFYYDEIEHDGVTYKNITMKGWTNQMSGVGSPAVPIKNIMVQLQPNTKPVASVIASEQVELTDTELYPAQEMRPDNQQLEDLLNWRPTFQKNSDIYGADSYYPGDFLYSVKLVKMRNINYAVIEVAPFKTNAVQKKLLVAKNLSIKVDLLPDGNSEAGLTSLAFNPAAGGFGGMGADSAPTNQPEKYMILMDDQFEGNAKLNQFIYWKKKKGYDVSVVKTSQIDPSGEPGHDDIALYLQGLPADEYPVYLLIIGDESKENGVEGFYFTTNAGGYSDIFFGCRDNDDWIPDLFYGRLPAENNEQLTEMLYKIIEMDRIPPNSDMYQKVVVAGQIQDREDYNVNVADRLFCETADAIGTYFEEDPNEVDYDVTWAMVNPNEMTADGYFNPGGILWSGLQQIGNRVLDRFVLEDEASDRVTANVNSGVALVQHRDHGATVGWADPGFSFVDVDELTNGANTPLVLSINCFTGSYHIQNSFVSSWLNHTNGGAYAVVAAVDESYSGWNDAFNHGLYAGLFEDYVSWHNDSTAPDWTNDLPEPLAPFGSGEATKLGKMVHAGKMYLYNHFDTGGGTELTFALFHLFGDPEADVRILTPQTQAVSHPVEVPVGASEVTVTTGEDGSLVCLYSEELGIQLVGTTTDGSITFPVSVTAAGDISVTVTRYDRRPYEGTIEAVLVEDTHYYTIQETPASTFVDIKSITTAGSGYITAGLYSSGGNYYIILTRMDREGTVLWQNSYFPAGSNNADVYSITAVSDGNYLVTGFCTDAATATAQSWIMKVTINGTVLWSKILNADFHNKAVSVGEEFHGTDIYYIVTGTKALDGDNDYLVLKLDENGNKVSNYAVNNGTYSDNCGMVDGGDHFFLLNQVKDSKEKIQVVKMSGDGVVGGDQIILERGSGLKAVSIISIPGGGAVIMGNDLGTIHLVRVDSNCNIVWQKQFTWGASGGSEGMDLTLNNEGNIVCLTRIRYPYITKYYDSMFFEVDLNGNLVGTPDTAFGTTANDMLNTFIEAPGINGGYMAAGQTMSDYSLLTVKTMVDKSVPSLDYSVTPIIGVSYPLTVQPSTNYQLYDVTSTISDLNVTIAPLNLPAPQLIQ